MGKEVLFNGIMNRNSNAGLADDRSGAEYLAPTATSLRIYLLLVIEANHLPMSVICAFP